MPRRRKWRWPISNVLRATSSASISPPSAARDTDGIRPGMRTIGFERRITIAFAVGETSVTILRIFYGGRDWQAELD